MPISATKNASRTPFPDIRDLRASEELLARGETVFDPGAQVTGRNAVDFVCAFAADQ
jgi:hypothetical protein